MVSNNAAHMSRTQQLMLDVVELLGQLTSDIELLPEIPRVLVSLLPVDRVTFALVQQTEAEPDRLLVSAGFEAPDGPQAMPVPSLAIHNEQTNYPDASDSLETVQDGANDTNNIHAGNATANRIPCPFEVTRQLDDSHKMVLILHWGKRYPSMPEEYLEIFNSISDLLSRSLRTLLSWWSRPELLGGRFTKITRCQWRILTHLYTQLSEKELADYLKTSPQTLHSHIKTIYQKLGVRGRLEAVRVLHQAVRQYRTKAREWSLPQSADRTTDAAMTGESQQNGPLHREGVGSVRWLARNFTRRYSAGRT